jgi:hypothetical protein
MVEKPSQSSGPYLVQFLKTSTLRLGGERESGLNDDGARRPLLCRFSDAGMRRAIHALRQPASENLHRNEHVTLFEE